jgi:hypothetical protein
MTKRPGMTTLQEDRSTAVTTAHTGLSALTKTISTASPGVANFLFDKMFPFTTPYQVYSGDCAGANPVKATSNPAYFDSHPESVVQLTPGGPQVQTIAFEPAIDVTATYTTTSTSAVSGANVYAYPKTAGCDAARIRIGTSGTLNNGRVDYPGLPFGVYDVCVDLTKTVNGNVRRWSKTWTGQSNTNYDGIALAWNFKSTDSNGTLCPQST